MIEGKDHRCAMKNGSLRTSRMSVIFPVYRCMYVSSETRGVDGNFRG